MSVSVSGSGGGGSGIVVSNTAPSDTKVLWIDTSIGGVSKYYNGTEWVPTLAVWG